MKLTLIGVRVRVRVTINNSSLLHSTLQVAALIFKKLKDNAESYLSTDVTDAVISIPAYFNNSQRLAVRNAGEFSNRFRLVSFGFVSLLPFSYRLRSSTITCIILFRLLMYPLFYFNRFF